MVQQTIQEKIKQRRRQMLVHSYLYYEKNTNIISDSVWSKWAMELVHLQSEYPKESAEVEFADQFQDWDGSSGAFLKFPESIISVAEHLLSYSEKKSRKSKPKVQKTKAKAIKSATRKLF